MQRVPTMLAADENWGGWWSVDLGFCQVKEEAVRPGDMSGTIYPRSQRPPQTDASNASRKPKNPSCRQTAIHASPKPLIG